jgi:very-short-patch-repair endonuclease
MKADPANNYAYNKNLHPFAKKLRKRMTKAEDCLWKYVLKGKKMKGYQFRRQRPVLNYIADFMCKEIKLIIEVDGFTHLLESSKIHDCERQKELEKAGFTVLRFTDREVLLQIDKVIEKIEHFIEDKFPPVSPPRGT